MATSPYAAPLWVPRFRAWNQAGTTPLASGKVYTYEAGTTTPLASYPTYDDALAGTNANANPVVLDSYGEAPIFLTNTLYKIVVKDSADVTQWTMDDVAPALGYPQPAVSEWIEETQAVTYVSGTSFSVATSAAAYGNGLPIKSINTGGTIYSRVLSTSGTTVTVSNNSGTLDSGLSKVYYGLISNTAFTRQGASYYKSGNQTAFAAATKVTTWTVASDLPSWWDNANNRFVVVHEGLYLVQAQIEFADTGTNVVVTPDIRVNGTMQAQSASRSHGTANNITSASVSLLYQLSAGEYVELYVTGSANTTVQGGKGTRLEIVRLPR
jgi:hypothetical protein